jgi:hypothetical protein
MRSFVVACGTNQTFVRAEDCDGARRKVVDRIREHGYPPPLDSEISVREASRVDVENLAVAFGSQEMKGAHR